jgi:hypothetical protein
MGKPGAIHDAHHVILKAVSNGSSVGSCIHNEGILNVLKTQGLVQRESIIAARVLITHIDRHSAATLLV